MLRHGAKDEQSDEIRDKDAHGDHPLLKHAEGSTASPRRVLCDVGGRDRRVGADGQPDQRTGDEQGPDVPRHGRQQRTGCVDARIDDEERLAPESIRERAGRECPRSRAERRTGHEVAGDEITHFVRHKTEDRPDVGRVVPEEEPTDRREQGEFPVERRGDAFIHPGQDVGGTG